MTPSATEWLQALGALEEWVRRANDGLATRDLNLPEPTPELPATRVPAELRLRAQVLLERMAATETEGLRRRMALVRSQTYGAA